MQFCYSPVPFIKCLPTQFCFSLDSRTVEAFLNSSGKPFYKAGSTTKNAQVQPAADFSHLQGGTFSGLRSDKSSCQSGP